ncbi:MAG: VWA domain-containing protein [Rickettsiales bacterium]|nr:VWA domain-containing protein [Rickettsiales bacterium]
MRLSLIHHSILPLMLFFSCFSVPALATDNNSLLLLIDSSNSMYEELGGEKKIDAVKETIEALAPSFPNDLDIRVASYGRDARNSCYTIKSFSPFVDGKNTSGLEKALEEFITPKHRKPIESALEPAVFAAEEGHEQGSNHVVVITDGLEACAINVCDEARRLSLSNPRLKIHAVGYAIDMKAYRPHIIQCIADDGAGQFINTHSKQELSEALKTIISSITKPETDKSPKKWHLLEEMTFSDADSMKNWRIMDPVEGQHTVKEGELVLIAPENAHTDDISPKNRLELVKKLPNGDWKISTRIDMEFITTHEAFEIGIRDKEGNYVAASFLSRGFAPATVMLAVTSSDNGAVVSKERQMFRNVLTGWQGTRKMAAERMPFDLELIRKNDRYFARALSAQNGRYLFETEEIKLDLKPESIYLSLYQRPNDVHHIPRKKHQTISTLKWVKIFNITD